MKQNFVFLVLLCSFTSQAEAQNYEQAEEAMNNAELEFQNADTTLESALNVYLNPGTEKYYEALALYESYQDIMSQQEKTNYAAYSTQFWDSFIESADELSLGEDDKNDGDIDWYIGLDEFYVNENYQQSTIRFGNAASHYSDAGSHYSDAENDAIAAGDAADAMLTIMVIVELRSISE